MYQGNQPSFHVNRRIDPLVFNGAQTVFPIYSGGNLVIPGNAEALIIFINGVAQDPTVDYTLSVSQQLVFTVAPASNATFHGLVLGERVNMLNAVAKTGDSMSGYLTLNGTPTQVNHAATKGYVDSGGDELVEVLTASASAVLGKTYIFDAASITLTLPASPAVGNRIWVINRSYVSGTINRNGSRIMGLTQNMTVDTQNMSFGLVYVDANIGWIIK